MRPTVVKPRADYDAAHGDVPLCWVCRREWAAASSLVLDAHDRELRVDGATPVPIKPGESEVLAVLINAFPRYMPRGQIVEYAYAERPDVDMPSTAAVSAVLSGLRTMLNGTRYVIESDAHRGVRLVTEEILARERREALAQIPGADKLASRALVQASAIAAEKQGKAPKEKASKSQKAPQGITNRTTKSGTPKISTNNDHHRRGRKKPHVRPK